MSKRQLNGADAESTKRSKKDVVEISKNLGDGSEDSAFVAALINKLASSIQDAFQNDEANNESQEEYLNAHIEELESKIAQMKRDHTAKSNECDQIIVQLRNGNKLLEEEIETYSSKAKSGDEQITKLREVQKNEIKALKEELQKKDAEITMLNQCITSNDEQHLIALDELKKSKNVLETKANDFKKELPNLRVQYETVQKSNTEKQDQITKLNQLNDTRNDEKQNHDLETKALREELAKLKTRSTSLSSQCSDAQINATGLKKELENQKLELDKLKIDKDREIALLNMKLTEASGELRTKNIELIKLKDDSVDSVTEIQELKEEVVSLRSRLLVSNAEILGPS